MTKRILLIGGSGLVGASLAGHLVSGADREVHALLRRSAGRVAPGWHEHVATPEQWPRIAARIGGDAAISALGTTMRAAGSQAAFRAVDFDMVVDFARAARTAGVRQMIAISSVGADPASANFYLRTKGEMESALTGLGFERTDLVRPGLLRGARGADRRRGERLGILLSPLVNLALRGRYDRFAAIDAAVVARAIAALVGRDASGVFVHHNRDLIRTASA